jgi:catechol 2,3-dioxygenase-like lactoylglutathione lyase family enzyme
MRKSICDVQEVNMEMVKALKVHVSISVTDVLRSTDFYRKMFGIDPSKVRPGYAKFDVSNPPLTFSLNEGLFSGPGALSHMGIQVSSTDDVIAVRDRWIREGLVTWDEMNTDCCYALQDKTWVRDPDGNAWEVFVVLEDNLSGKTPVAALCRAPTCCSPSEVTRG